MADAAKKKNGGRKPKATRPVKEKPKKVKTKDSAGKPKKKKIAVKAIVKTVKAVKAAVKAAKVVRLTKPAVAAAEPEPAVVERWFWVSALYKLTPIGNAMLSPERSNQWERRVFVVRAQRGDERRVARRIAKEHETRHNVPKGEKAVWRLQDIEAYAELFDEQIESGTEVYWQFFARPL